MVLVQRCRHADDHRVHAGDLRVIRRSAKARLLRRFDLAGEDADDIGATGVERLHLARLDVEARHSELLAAEEQRQGQAHISHPDDANEGLPGVDLLLESGHPVFGRSCHVHHCRTPGSVS